MHQDNGICFCLELLAVFMGQLPALLALITKGIVQRIVSAFEAYEQHDEKTSLQSVNNRGTHLLIDAQIDG